MLAYLYNNITNEYIGPTVVLQDPLESAKAGKEILAFPPNCTLLAPPELQENEVAIFDISSNEWKIEKDYRGCEVYSRRGTPMIIEEIGDIPTNYSLEKPITLQELKVSKVNEVKELCKELLSKELTINKIKANISERAKLLKLFDIFGNHAIINYENTDEESVPVTKEEIEEAEKYLYLYEILLVKAKNELIGEIRGCTNKKDVSSIEVKINIDKELDKLMKASEEEISEYLTAGV